MNNSQNKSEKIYLGSGRKRSDKWLTISICISDAEKYANEYKGKRYVNLNVNINDAPNQYGKDVSVILDTYKKENQSNPVQPVQKINKVERIQIDNLNEDELPF